MYLSVRSSEFVFERKLRLKQRRGCIWGKGGGIREQVKSRGTEKKCISSVHVLQVGLWKWKGGSLAMGMF